MISGSSSKILPEPNTEKRIEDLQAGDRKCGNCSMQGWRKHMEDAHIARFNLAIGANNLSIFAVFDGHRGPSVARFCQRHIVDVLSLNENIKQGNFEEGLKETFLEMDDLLKKPVSQEELKKLKEPTDKRDATHAGCTACLALIVDDTLYVANAGDSRMVLCSDEKAIQLTKDHKPELEEEKERIENAGGFITGSGRIDGNLNLSRTIGDMDFKNNPEKPETEQKVISLPDTFTRPIAPQDEFLVLGCDGIWEYYNNQEMVELIRSKMHKQPNLSRICAELCENACPKDEDNEGSFDNMTLIIVTLKGKSEPTDT